MARNEIPRTRYARSGDVNIAYQVVGDAPRDLVYVPGWISNVERAWDEPTYARFLTRLASCTAAANEVRVTNTVKDLVAGSGIEFDDVASTA